MTTNTQKKWYEEPVREWLINYNSHIKDNELFATPLNDMYIDNTFDLVELSEKVVAIVNTVAFSVVLFMKNVGTVKVALTYEGKTGNHNELRRTDFKSVIITVDDVKRNERKFKKVIMKAGRNWQNKLMDFVVDYILTHEHLITEKMVKENISLSCLNLIQWATLKNSSSSQLKTSSNYQKISVNMTTPLVMCKNEGSIGFSSMLMHTSLSRVVNKNLMNRLILQLRYNDVIGKYEIDVLDVYKCEMHTIPTEKHFNVIILNKKAISALMMSALADAWDELTPDIHPKTFADINPIVQRRKRHLAFCVEMKASEILDTALATKKDIPLNYMTAAISMFEDVILSRVNDKNDENPLVIAKVLTEEPTFGLTNDTRIYVELKPKYTWTVDTEKANYTEAAKRLVSQELNNSKNDAFADTLNFTVNDNYAERRELNEFARVYILDFLIGLNSDEVHKKSIKAIKTRKEFNEKIIYGILNKANDELNEAILDRKQHKYIKENIISLFR